jgi:hypothetical protein
MGIHANNKFKDTSILIKEVAALKMVLSEHKNYIKDIA